mgnify:CR=1 FL=1
MKKLVLILAILLVMTSVMAKGDGEEGAEAAAAMEAGPYEDGIYFAEEPGFGRTGWKYVVTLEVNNGYIVSADWNGANIDAGYDKKTVSKNGDYNMVAFGGAQSEWDVQAEAAEAYLLETQDPTAITYTDDAGHTDDIAGVSIHVIEFFSLVEEALEAGPVDLGPYADGHYHAEEAEFGRTGWKYMVDLTVANGRIVAVNWNGANINAGTDKKTTAKEGNYNMVAYGGAQSEWDVQAEAAEAYLLETQDPTAISYTDDEGHTDDIAGVSIHVVEFFSLVEEALEAGPVDIGPYDNGVYEAEGEFSDNGWKSTVSITVIGGNIAAVNFDSVNRDGESKAALAAEGKYGMVERGGAQASWDVQARRAADYLLAMGPDAAIDDIAGVSITVDEHFALAAEALGL